MAEHRFEIRPKTIGSDRVAREGENLVIYASTDMPDWYVREYRRPAIFFEGERYFIAEKSLLGGADAKIRYVLSPWPEELMDLPSSNIIYDEDYVRARDEAINTERKNDLGRIFLFPFQFLIGFLPSSIKLKIEEDYGIEAYRATVYSIWIEFLAIFIHCCMLVIATFTTRLNLYYLLAVVFLLLPDVIIRYDHSKKESESPFGFYEWLFKVKRY